VAIAHEGLDPLALVLLEELSASVGEARRRGSSVCQLRVSRLHRDELTSWITALLEMIGVDQPRSIIAGARKDRLE
jgi:hypothetical protein